MSSQNHIRLFFLVAILIIGGVLGFFVLRPFIEEIFLAVVIVVVAHPIHTIVRKAISHKNLAAGISTVAVLLLIIIPISLVGTLLVRETVDFATSFTENGAPITEALTQLDEFLAEHIAAYNVGTLSPASSGAYMRQVANWAAQNLQGIFSNVFTWFVSTAIMLLALFYLFKEGDVLYKHMLKASPLDNKFDNIIGHRIASIMRAVIRERLIVGIIQGAAAYLGFVFFGIDHAMLLAAVTTIIAILPLVGTMFVILPVALYQLAIGAMLPAIGLILWGTFIVGLVDNIVGPLLIHDRTNIHPFIVLIAILGGFQLFGPVGFVAGPVVIGVVYVLFDLLPVVYEKVGATATRSRRTSKKKV